MAAANAPYEGSADASHGSLRHIPITEITAVERIPGRSGPINARLQAKKRMSDWDCGIRSCRIDQSCQFLNGRQPPTFAVTYRLLRAMKYARVGFSDVDLSLTKNTQIKEAVNIQFRADAFNVLNHPNFAQPNQTVTSSDFGRITTTQSARGDLGSSRQIQLGLKVTF